MGMLCDVIIKHRGFHQQEMVVEWDVIFLYVITIPYNYNSLAIKMYPYVY